MAQAAVNLSGPEPAPVRKPPVTTPLSWENLKGDRTVVGDLTAVDCGENQARLHVAGKILGVSDPSRVSIKGGGKTTLACGPQHRSVSVEYLSDSNEVTAIEFK